MMSFKSNIGQKNAQISETDFGKPKNWEIFPYFSNFKFLGVIFKRLSRGNNVRGQGQKKVAKDRLFEDRPSRGQG